MLTIFTKVRLCFLYKCESVLGPKVSLYYLIKCFQPIFVVFHTVSNRLAVGDIHVENEDVSLNCHLYTPYLQSVWAIIFNNTFLASNWSVIFSNTFLASDWSVILATISCLLIGPILQ